MTTVETEPENTVQSRIEAIASKAARAEELSEEAQQIEKKQQLADSKNSGFRALQSTLAEVREQYEQLVSWTQYASELNVTVQQDQTRDLLDDISRDLQSFKQRTYDDFDSRSAVDDIEEEFEGYRKDLLEQTRDVRNKVQDEAGEELDAVQRIQSLLQIPDIGTEEDQTVCNDYWYDLTQLEKGNLQNVGHDDLAADKEAFESLDISLEGFGLTDEAQEVIWDILRDEAVTLADIDTEVLNDLKTFEEFSNRLSVEFTNQQ